jgi:hypothetical protein
MNTVNRGRWPVVVGVKAAMPAILYTIRRQPSAAHCVP